MDEEAEGAAAEGGEGCRASGGSPAPTFTFILRSPRHHRPGGGPPSAPGRRGASRGGGSGWGVGGGARAGPEPPERGRPGSGPPPRPRIPSSASPCPGPRRAGRCLHLALGLGAPAWCWRPERACHAGAPARGGKPGPSARRRRGWNWVLHLHSVEGRLGSLVKF